MNEKNSKNVYKERIMIGIIFLMLTAGCFIANILNISCEKIFTVTFFCGAVSVILIIFIIHAISKYNKHSFNRTFSMDVLLRATASAFFIIATAFLMFSIDAHFVHFFSKESQEIVENITQEKKGLLINIDAGKKEQILSNRVTNKDEKFINTELLTNEDILGLLALLGTFAGMLSYIFKEIVKRDIKESARRENKKMKYYIRAESFKDSGNAQYVACLERDDKKETKCLENVLWYFEEALSISLKTYRMSKEDKDSWEDGHEYYLQLNIIKNNIAWIILLLKDAKRAKEAKECIDFVISERDNHSRKHIRIWYDTKIKIDKWLKEI
jgi:ABC-type multidrug transport system fused ATPase/permease subunit